MTWANQASAAAPLVRHVSGRQRARDVRLYISKQAVRELLSFVNQLPYGFTAPGVHWPAVPPNRGTALWAPGGAVVPVGLQTATRVKLPLPELR